MPVSLGPCKVLHRLHFSCEITAVQACHSLWRSSLPCPGRTPTWQASSCLLTEGVCLQIKHTEMKQTTAGIINLGPRSKLKLPPHLSEPLERLRQRRSDVEHALERASHMLLATRCGWVLVSVQVLQGVACTLRPPSHPNPHAPPQVAARSICWRQQVLHVLKTASHAQAWPVGRQAATEAGSITPQMSYPAVMSQSASLQRHAWLTLCAE